MSFIYTNVDTFSFGIFNINLKNFIIEVCIIILIKNLKDSNCILISRKEGSINSPKHFCYLSKSYQSIATYKDKSLDFCELSSKNASNEDFETENCTKQLDSTVTYPLESVVQESVWVNSHNKSVNRSSNEEYVQLIQSKPKVKRLDSNNFHFLSDIDIGLIKNVNCNRVIDVEAVFKEGSDSKSSETYGLYRENLLKVLTNELEGSGYRNALDLICNRWKTMDNVAISRGFRILLTGHWLNKRFTKLVETFVQVLSSMFVTDVYSFETVMRAINRAYTDGWVLSLIFISIMKSFGIEYFKRVTVFRDFKSTLGAMDVFKNTSNTFTRNLGFELHDSNRSRSECMDSVYNSSIYSCFHSRKYVILMSLYYEKLLMNHLMNSGLEPTYKLSLNKELKRQIKEFLKERKDQSGTGFDELIKRSLTLMPHTNFSYDFEVIQSGISNLKSMQPAKMNASDWSMCLILKHSLSNIFSSTEFVVSNPILSEVPLSKFEDASKLKDLLKVGENLDNLLGFSRDILSFISKQIFFCKNWSYSAVGNSMEATIDYIRGFESSGRVMGVSDIYNLMRLLLRHKIGGATALNMIFMLIPKLVFSNWCHYHIFVCCLEHDFENEDLNSIDELLQYMIKLNCKPDSGLYDRFFALCNSLDKPLLVLKHFKLISENGLNWEERDPYTSKTTITISFGLYEQVLISSIKTGKVETGIKALKHLIESLKGTYKSIPSSIWKSFIKLIELAQLDKSLMAILNQICLSSSSVNVGMSTPLYLEIPKHKSVILRQIEGILDKYINSN